MEKIWPTPTGTIRIMLLSQSQCLDSTITGPTCPRHFQPENKATKIVNLAICLSQRWTCPPNFTHSPKPTLIHGHRLVLRAQCHTTAGSSPRDNVISFNKGNKSPNLALVIWDCKSTKNRDQGPGHENLSPGPKTYSRGATKSHQEAKAMVRLPLNPNPTHSKQTGGTGTRRHMAKTGLTSSSPVLP